MKKYQLKFDNTTGQYYEDYTKEYWAYVTRDDRKEVHEDFIKIINKLYK